MCLDPRHRADKCGTKRQTEGECDRDRARSTGCGKARGAGEQAAATRDTTIGKQHQRRSTTDHQATDQPVERNRLRKARYHNTSSGIFR